MPASGQPIAQVAATVPRDLTVPQIRQTGPGTMARIDGMPPDLANQSGFAADVVVDEHNVFDAAAPRPLNSLVVACGYAHIGRVGDELAAQMMMRRQFAPADQRPVSGRVVDHNQEKITIDLRRQAFVEQRQVFFAVEQHRDERHCRFRCQMIRTHHLNKPFATNSLMLLS